jgi:hypothetical protein
MSKKNMKILKNCIITEIYNEVTWRTGKVAIKESVGDSHPLMFYVIKQKIIISGNPFYRAPRTG